MGNIAIFRINYKSDFVLTLNSDAGWMTPFCIKFWTGAPSQAYFAGWDGTTYTNCTPVAGEPTKLLVQFDDHHLPVGELKFQIGYHFTIADFPNDTEDEVLNQERVIIEIDGHNEKVMLDFNGETAPDIQFSLPAYANEAQRIANEQERIANEQQRIDNEQERIDNEQTRQRNEGTRIENEQQRVQEFGQMKGELEQATRDAAAAAENANEKGVYAKNQGDYAKQQGDYAKQQGDIAQADHERAEEDHRIAGEDHTQAGSDHTRAGEDHTQAGSDHTRAGEDHTRAGDDHTRADQDHTRAESDHAAVELYVDSLGAFDISAYHATGGVLATYANLQAALGTNGANIPEALRKGGMSVKFVQGTVQSSDNIYVQARLMADEFTTDVTKWQGVDAVPTAGSHNLVESGGVEDELSKIKGGTFTYVFNSTWDERLLPTPWPAGSTIKNMGDIDIDLRINGTYVTLKVGSFKTLNDAVDKIKSRNVTGMSTIVLNSTTKFITDDIPTGGSNFLVKSGGVFKIMEELNTVQGSIQGSVSQSVQSGASYDFKVEPNKPFTIHFYNPNWDRSNYTGSSYIFTIGYRDENNVAHDLTGKTPSSVPPTIDEYYTVTPLTENAYVFVRANVGETVEFGIIQSELPLSIPQLADDVNENTEQIRELKTLSASLQGKIPPESTYGDGARYYFDVVPNEPCTIHFLNPDWDWSNFLSTTGYLMTIGYIDDNGVEHILLGRTAASVPPIIAEYYTFTPLTGKAYVFVRANVGETVEFDIIPSVTPYTLPLLANGIEKNTEDIEKLGTFDGIASYYGEKVQINKMKYKSEYKFTKVNSYFQGFTRNKDYVIAIENEGYIHIHRASDYAELGKYQLPTTSHCSNCFFSNEKYDASDLMPILYVTDASNGSQTNVLGFRLTLSGATQVQNIIFQKQSGQSGYFVDVVGFDRDTNKVYVVALTALSWIALNNNYIIYQYDMPVLSQGSEVTLSTPTLIGQVPFPDSLFEPTETEYANPQAIASYNGQLFLHVGRTSTLSNLLFIVDITTGTQKNMIRFGRDVRSMEAEGNIVYDSKYYDLAVSGEVTSVVFE